MFRRHQGDSILEWVVLGVLVLVLLGAAVYSLCFAISTEYQELNSLL